MSLKDELQKKIREDINILKDKQELLEFISANTSDDDILISTILENLIENDFARELMPITGITYEERESFLDNLKQQYLAKGIQKGAIEQALDILVTGMNLENPNDNSKYNDIVEVYEDEKTESDESDENDEAETSVNYNNASIDIHNEREDEKNICPKCCNLIDKKSKFCPECGYDLINGDVIKEKETASFDKCKVELKSYYEIVKTKINEFKNDDYDNKKKLILTVGIIIIIFFISFINSADKRFEQNLQKSYSLISNVTNVTTRIDKINLDEGDVNNKNYLEELKKCKKDIDEIYSLRNIWFLSVDKKESNAKVLSALELRGKIIDKEIELLRKPIYSENDKSISEVKALYKDLNKIKINELYALQNDRSEVAFDSFVDNKIDYEKRSAEDRLKKFVANELKKNKPKVEKSGSGFFWVTTYVKPNGRNSLILEGSFVNQSNKKITKVDKMKAKVTLYCNKEKVYETEGEFRDFNLNLPNGKVDNYNLNFNNREIPNLAYDSYDVTYSFEGY